MLVVSNTSPILNLALIDSLSLIREQFATVTICLKISLSKVKALKIKLLQKISPNASILKPAQWNSKSILLGRNDPQNQNNIKSQFKLRTWFIC